MENSSHNAETNPDFEDDGGAPEARDALILRLEGYEGPIDLLLDLARDPVSYTHLRAHET